MVNFPTRQANILVVNNTEIISNVHPIDGLQDTDHKAISFDINFVLFHQLTIIVIVTCTIIIRLILLSFVILCAISLEIVSLVVMMLRRHGHCGRIYLLVLLMLLF